MSEDAALDEALKAAHIPTLMLALVHLTGDASHLKDAPPIVYDPLGDGQGGLPPAWQEAMRTKAREAWRAWKAGKPLAAQPDQATLRRMMDTIAGMPIPEHYVPFLLEELAMDGADPKRPAPIAPKLKASGRKLKVLIVGAGMSGLLSGLRLKQAGVDFEIVEKNEDVGGTWLDNLYPGCRVDNPSHMYSYSFEDNHVWPYLYSTQPVLLEYFRGVAKRHDLRPHVRFGTTVDEARFDEAANVWRVAVRGKDGKAETLVADAVISAVGQLNQPRYPTEIEGFGTFKGPAFHSARWDHGVDLKGKDVAVIGTGASAFQFVPAIAPEVAHMTVFQRTPPWLSPTPDYHFPTSEGMNWLIRNMPFYDKWYRFWLFWMGTDGIYEAMKADPAWDGNPRAYLGVSAPGFPNFFMLYGPNTNIVVNGSIIFFSECGVRYIMGCLDLLAESGAATMEVRKDVHDAFNAKVDAQNARMAWGSPHVSSWYKNALGRVSQNWPFPNVEYWQATLKPNPDDFILDGAKAKAAA